MMRERLVISVFLAILTHFVLLLVLQLVLKFERSRIPEYTGPLYVTLGETPDVAPVIEKAQEPKQLPRMEREQPRVEQEPTEQARPEQGSESAGLPRIRSVPTPPDDSRDYGASQNRPAIPGSRRDSEQR